MFSTQGNACARCKTTETKQWCIDHDHNCCPGRFSCGKCIRGILCKSCNTFLKGLEDSLESGTLTEDIAYLTQLRATSRTIM